MDIAPRMSSAVLREFNSQLQQNTGQVVYAKQLHVYKIHVCGVIRGEW